jgi:Uma2 family endonuclease
MAHASRMPVLMREPYPEAVEALLERRRLLGLDTFDEVWDGVLHIVSPGPSYEHGRIVQALAESLPQLARRAGLEAVLQPVNIGLSGDDFRVPDGGLFQQGTSGTWLTTAALVVEVRSANDESWEKLRFYAAHQVDEVLIIEPDNRAIHWLGLHDDGYAPIERSTLIDLGLADLPSVLGWS